MKVSCPVWRRGKGGDYIKSLPIPKKLDRYLRCRLSMEYRGGDMLQPWFTNDREPDRTYKLELEYFFDIVDMPQDLDLVIEHPEHFDILMNGCSIEGNISGWWVDKCFSRIPLSIGLLKTGRNSIRLKTDFHEKLDLEAVYLLGNFGVSLEKSRKLLTKLPELIRFADLTSQGFPFYSGGIRYKLDYGQILPQEGEGMFLETDKPAAAYVRLVSDIEEGEITAWPPYRLEMTGLIKYTEIWLEAVLTRRNTFGPLHLTKPLLDAYGPDTFITERDEFTEEYGLLPSGLLSPPRMVICKQAYQ